VGDDLAHHEGFGDVRQWICLPQRIVEGERLRLVGRVCCAQVVANAHQPAFEHDDRDQDGTDRPIRLVVVRLDAWQPVAPLGNQALDQRWCRCSRAVLLADVHGQAHVFGGDEGVDQTQELLLGFCAQSFDLAQPAFQAWAEARLARSFCNGHTEQCICCAPISNRTPCRIICRTNRRILIGFATLLSHA